MIDHIHSDVRIALRSLARSPGFAVTTTAILGSESSSGPAHYASQWLNSALRQCHLLSIALLAGCGLESSQHPSASGASIRPGTYALRVCRVVCGASDTANVIRAGFIVLDTAPIHLHPSSVSGDRLLREMKMITVDTANGCYVLESRRSVATLAGGWGGGFVQWRRLRTSDSITFMLDRTSDSGHEDTVAFTARGFAGSGHSNGMDIDYPADLVAGDYLGPPDQRRCAEALSAFGEALKRLEQETTKHPEWQPPRPPRRRLRVRQDLR